jgi:hypothetical protein
VRNPRSWDQSGMPMAEDDAGVIKERIFLDKNNPNILHDEMTTTDNSLTRPWSVMKNYRRAQTVWWGRTIASTARPGSPSAAKSIISAATARSCQSRNISRHQI